MAGIEECVGSETMGYLVDIGFIAVSRGYFDHARAIFESVKILRPQQEAGFLGIAMISVLSGQPELAVPLLEASPVTPATRVFYGIALIQSGEVLRGREVLQAASVKFDDLPHGQLARAVLEGCVMQ